MSEQSQNVKFTGSSISVGLAAGPAFVYRDILHDLEMYEIGAHEVEAEHARIQRANEKVLQELRLSAERVEAELDADLALIFRAHEAMLQDPVIVRDLRKELEDELINAEQVVKRVFRRWERKIRAASNEQNRQRGDDVADLSRRLLGALSGVRGHVLANMPQGSVLVATRLFPSDTVHLSRKSVAAVVVGFGGTASHAALLTRALGIPAVTQVPEACDQVAPGDMVLVDGFAGTVVVAPNAQTQASFQMRIDEQSVSLAAARQHCHEPVKTPDGLSVLVMANIGSREDALLAAENGADGVGLYRLEQFYLSRKVLPSEEELLTAMRRTLEPVAGATITVRLLDVGGDKNSPSLNFGRETNPFLGRRGVRLLLAYPELLNTQLRALLRLAQDHDVQILVPMVTVPEDMQRLKESLRIAAADAGANKVPPIGAMIETPAAALCVADIVKHADFLSIGTNDLTQYTMAAGREDPLVSDYFQDDHPVVLRLLRLITEAAGDTPVALCGELAGRSDAMPVLLGLGVRCLSVAPPLVPIVKEAARTARAGGQ